MVKTIKKIKNLLSYLVLILFGSLITVGTFVKLVFEVKIDSDWFWFLAGIALTIEGIINLSKQRKFDKKYKIVYREEK